MTVNLYIGNLNTTELKFDNEMMVSHLERDEDGNVTVYTSSCEEQLQPGITPTLYIVFSHDEWVKIKTGEFEDTFSGFTVSIPVEDEKIN